MASGAMLHPCTARARSRHPLLPLCSSLPTETGKLLVRDNAIILSIEHIRLIITADKVRGLGAQAGWSRWRARGGLGSLG